MYNTPVYALLSAAVKPLALGMMLGMCLASAACGKKGPLYLPPQGGEAQTIPAPVPPSDDPQR